MAPSHDFKGRRLALAHALRDWATAKEAASDLGTEPASVFGLLQRMHGEGTLEADSDPEPPTRGTQYRLTHDARLALEQLDHALGDSGGLGQLAEDQRLLLARGTALLGIERILADPALAASVAWITWLGASWLIALAQDADGHTERRLASAIEAAGLACERGRVGDLQTGSRMRRQSEANLERIGTTP